MKVRLGFVTNSSSSSFILGFSSKENMENELIGEGLEEEYLSRILKDCENEMGYNLDDILDLIYDEESWYGYRRVNEEVLEKFKNLAQGKNYFVEVSYSDNDGTLSSALEHDIVPELTCCLKRFSHH